MKGGLLAAHLIRGNVDDRAVVPPMTKQLIAFLFGDKGYIDKKLFHDLSERGLKLVKEIKARMKNKLMPLLEKKLLRKRSIIETLNSVIKKDFQISHSRHRPFINGFIHHIFNSCRLFNQTKETSLSLL